MTNKMIESLIIVVIIIGAITAACGLLGVGMIGVGIYLIYIEHLISGAICSLLGLLLFAFVLIKGSEL